VYAEDELLPLSGLQHLLYCERRAYLVHAEMVWRENVATAEGRMAHERAHQAGGESRRETRIERGVRVRSLKLGLSGICDVVEFYRQPDAVGGCRLPGGAGRWLPFPVEYKRGALRHEEGYAVQLCAQARCLEEMLHVSIPAGALFYGASHKRLDVTFDAALRSAVENGALRLRVVLALAEPPQPVNDARCRLCSLHSVCLPAISSRRSAQAYVHRLCNPAL
jgi:CRISPR-associated exonuclease Cas4